MLVGLWRTVVSLLGGFPALRDAAGTKGESWVVLAGCGGLLRAYRNWQLMIALSLSLHCFAYLHLLLFCILCFWQLELRTTWTFTKTGYKDLGTAGINRAQRSRRYGVPICEEQAEGRAGYGQEHQGPAGKAAQPGWSDSKGERVLLQDELRRWRTEG